jgi:hypothetical protein
MKGTVHINKEQVMHLLGCDVVCRMLCTAIVVPSLLILFSLIMEAIRSFEMSVLTRVTRRYIPENNILHSHSSETPRSYNKERVSLPALCVSISTKGYFGLKILRTCFCGK